MEKKPLIPPPSSVLISSLIASKDASPRVDIQFESKVPGHMQMEAEAAIKIGLDIIKVAYGAYIDAFVWNYMKDKVGLDPERCGFVVSDFREYRDKLEIEFKKMQEPDQKGR